MPNSDPTRRADAIARLGGVEKAREFIEQRRKERQRDAGRMNAALDLALLGLAAPDSDGAALLAFVDWIGSLDSSDLLPGIDGKDKPMPFVHGAAQMRNHIHLAGLRELAARQDTPNTVTLTKEQENAVEDFQKTAPPARTTYLWHNPPDTEMSFRTALSAFRSQQIESELASLRAPRDRRGQENRKNAKHLAW